jgi:hypothetical protein
MAIAHDHDHVMTMRSVVILYEQSSWYGNNCHQEDYIMNNNTIYIESLQVAQSTLLIEVERLVERIRQTDPRQLHTLFPYIAPKLAAYIALYRTGYDYSEHLQAFWHGCEQAAPYYGYDGRNITYLNCLIESIRAYTQSKQFKRRALDRRYQTKQNAISIEQYAYDLHQQYSRLLVIRVDFGYYLAHQHLVDIDLVYQHLDKMRLSRYNDGLFEHLVGSAWCLEQGESKGYHIHAVYYFKGSEHQNDWYMAQQIGERWVAMTEGLGTYHSCNTPKEKNSYEQRGKLGVGMIHRNNAVACENAVNAVGYLAKHEKDDQYLRMKPTGRRAFATGA